MISFQSIGVVFNCVIQGFFCPVESITLPRQWFRSNILEYSDNPFYGDQEISRLRPCCQCQRTRVQLFSFRTETLDETHTLFDKSAKSLCRSRYPIRWRLIRKPQVTPQLLARTTGHTQCTENVLYFLCQSKEMFRNDSFCVRSLAKGYSIILSIFMLCHNG